MDLGDHVVFLLQSLHAARQRVSDLEVSITFRSITVVALVILKRHLHISNCFDKAMCLLCQLMFLTIYLISLSLRVHCAVDILGNLTELAVESLRQSREELRHTLTLMMADSEGEDYLGLARVPLMARNSNVVKKAMQLADDGGDLLGQVARVHDCRASRRLW